MNIISTQPISLVVLFFVVGASAFGQDKADPKKSDPSAIAQVGELTAAQKAAAEKDAQTHNFDLIGLYSGKSKLWDIGGGFVGDFGALRKPNITGKAIIHRDGTTETIADFNYGLFLSGVVGFTSQGSNEVHAGFGMGLRNVFFGGTLSVLGGGYISFNTGHAEFKWLGAVSFKF
jgi:hypothetical protein